MKTIFQTFLLLFTFYFSGIAQWSNPAPVPNGNHLRNVFFINDDYGWIVGSDGFITKTTNAGIDWAQQISQTANDLKAVTFIDENNGWVVGENGLILKTSDGGQVWVQIVGPTTCTLNTVDFINSSIGWIAGDGGTILKTIDSGYTWITQSSGTNYPISSVSFINSFTGWAACLGNDEFNTDSTIILKTVDGGDTWFSQAFVRQLGQGIHLYSVCFINKNIGWAAGGSFPGINGWGNAIIKTTDGGNTWNEQNLGNEPEHLQDGIKQSINFEGYGGIRSVFFKDANYGYAVGGQNT